MLSSRRLIILVVVIGLAISVAFTRMLQVQVFDRPKYAAAANDQQIETRITQAPRGAIFDRAGNLLAVSRRAYIVRVDLRTLTDTVGVATALAPVTGRQVEEVRRHIEAILEDHRSLTPTLSTIVAYNLLPDATHQLTQTMRLFGRSGLLVDETWARVYPHGPVAGPTLGFVSLQPVGYSGVEAYYDDRLSSSVGQRKERSRLDLLVITPTRSGADMVLTLDLNLQAYVEARLAQAIRDTGASGGTVIVMETATGAILASASWPGYDPNRAIELASTPNARLLRDPAVSDAYEPGSVLKVLTLATALELGQVTTQTILTDTGRLVIHNQRIYNSDRSRHGRVDIEDILAHSLNVPTARIALDMGEEAFYARFKLFGFGHRTGIDLGGEVPGTLRTPSSPEWSLADLATNSYGQGLAATPYQVINAINAIANDGILMQPYVVQQWRTPSGETVQKQPVPVARVLSAETARTMRQVMMRATRRGTPRALIPGYSVAGKTGTADWYLNGVKQETTIVTYVGFLPASAPRITILVKLDQPQTSRWAAPTTVPVFHDVAEYACRILDIPPDAAD
ncbi:MAG: penicillin-binding protein 2 [Thermoflexales bacterium]|nr:penicillin-binding protein 2 [Thermoflexales bacterium]MDW8351526.1 penicillin-binding protein 2 [Anaerolineae bacterium]